MSATALTDAMVVAAARMLNKRAAEECGVDEEDQWKLYGETFKLDALAAMAAGLEAAPQSPVVFDRRWRIAADGFGLQRDDQDGPYVHIDDALDVLHRSLMENA